MRSMPGAFQMPRHTREACVQRFFHPLFHSWPPIAAFAAVALVYLLLNALLGTHLTFAVQAIALAVLFLATPVFALICVRIPSSRKRLAAALIGGALCTGVWIGLITLYFSSGQGPPQGMFSILRCGLGSVLLYVPLIWLACGGSRPASPNGIAAPGEFQIASRRAFRNAIIWLLVAGTLATVPAVLLAFGEWWGPMSLFTVPVAGIICALNAIRDSRGTGHVTRWLLFAIAVALILRFAYFAGFLLLVSGWLH
jgi:hypothetical protein